MTILVTGGAGFIGSHLCERLLAEHRRVVALDNFNDYYAPSIKRANIAQCLDDKNFLLATGDIRDERLVEELFAREKFEAIVHLAAMAGVRPSLEQPLLYADVNIQGTLRLAEAARKHNVKNFVFGSSSSVYGGNPRIPFREDDALEHVLSPYAATKLAGEYLLRTYWKLHEINICCLRFFTVYGPRQRPEMAIHQFTRAIVGGQPVKRYGDGSSQRDYTYIDDIIQGVMLAIEKNRGFSIYNLGESETISLDALLEELATALGRKVTIKEYSDQPGDAKRTCADINKAREQLGYNPQTKIKEGVRKFVRWYLQTCVS